MKEVLAVIRMNTMNATKRALADAGVPSLTARKVMGRGRRPVDYQILKGAEDGVEEAISQLGPGPRLVPKRMISVIVPDAKVPVVVQAIIDANRTGNPGDGKVFVLPVLDAARVRTGETGETAIDESAA